MGVVYRALDARLQRAVALKVLNDERLSAEQSDRLIAEARAASALNHPGVCTIYEVREEQGHAFLVMEYVDGKPLDQQIPHEGLSIDTVIRYGIQIADALGHAHDS